MQPVNPSEEEIPTEELPQAEPPRKNGGKHRRGEQWGPREVLAAFIIMGSFAYAFIALVTDHPSAEVPAWVAVLVGGIAVYYYKNGKGA